MKKLEVVIVLLLVVLLTGCAKVMTETYEVVPAVVTDASYTPAFVTSSADSKGHITTHYHSASGHVEIVCKGRNEILGGVSLYERFYDHIGDEVWAIIRIRVYDNDKVKETVVNLLETKEQAERLIDTEEITDEVR